MPRPFLIDSQSDYLMQIVDINSHTEWQTVQIQISWLLQKPTDLDLHCLQRQGISGLSAGQDLRVFYNICPKYQETMTPYHTWPNIWTSLFCYPWICLKTAGFPANTQRRNNVVTRSLCLPRWLSWMRRPTGDQEVAGSTPAKVGNILSWRLIMKYFLWSFSLFHWFKKGSCQFLVKECAQYW